MFQKIVFTVVRIQKGFEQQFVSGVHSESLLYFYL